MEREQAYHYIVVNKHLREHPGVLAVQVTHAAAESVRTIRAADEDIACVLVADSAADLEQLSDALGNAGLSHVLIREPEPPYSGAATAIGMMPTANRAAVRAVLGHLKVLR